MSSQSNPVATKIENEEQTAHILFSDRLLEAYYMSDDEESPSGEGLPENFDDLVDIEDRIKVAEELVANFEY